MDKITKFYQDNVFTLPDGIDISNNKHGLGLFATKNFKKGETVFLFKLVEEDIKNIKKVNHILKINNKGIIQKYNINIFKHRSDIVNNMCIMTDFSCLLNHSCNSNILNGENFIIIDSLNNVTMTKYYALKDINIGDELTCNYQYFFYDMGSSAFDCLCGSKNCYKKIKGMKYLPIIEKIKLLMNPIDNYYKYKIINDIFINEYTLIIVIVITIIVLYYFKFKYVNIRRR